MPLSDIITPTFGWHEQEAAAGVARVEAMIRGMGRPASFASAAPQLAGFGDGKTVILHRIARSVLGSFLPAQNQPRGTCVSRGAKRIVDLTQLVQIALGALQEFRLSSHAYIYGTCKEYGNDLTYRDGAVGAWAAWSVANDGNLSNAEAKDDDNKDDLAVEWGAKGVPEAIKKIGRLRLIKAVAKINSFNEARDAICAGHGITVASNIGYEGIRSNRVFGRDSTGRARRGGTWNHQMCFTGYRADRDELLQDQSWGPDSPDGPIGDIEIPSYSFWTSRADAEAQISQGDTWAFSAFDGWPAQQLDQFI